MLIEATSGFCFQTFPGCHIEISVFHHHFQGWGENDRGVSFTFGADIVTKFLRRHTLDLICRAHQVVEDGYEFFAKRQLVTLFSAPNYCGEFDNAGGMMSVDETLMCSFQVCRVINHYFVPRCLGMYN